MAKRTTKANSQPQLPRTPSAAETQLVRSPGRPKLFVREEALRQAMHLFWSKGFNAVSYTDLTKAMGMTAPSIYLAFGSKEKLFEEAYLLYAEEGATGLRALAAPRTAKEGIECMLKSVVRAFTDFNEPRGCMTIVGSMSLPAEQESLREMLKRARQSTLAVIQQRLDAAVDTGELSNKTDTKRLSCLCRTMWSGLSVQILDGVSRSELYGTIDLFVGLLGFEELENRGSVPPTLRSSAR